MKINKTRLLKVLCLVGYGLFIGTTLIQSFDAYAESMLLMTIGKCGLGFGAATMLIYLFNKDGKICSLKNMLKHE